MMQVSIHTAINPFGALDRGHVGLLVRALQRLMIFLVVLDVESQGVVSLVWSKRSDGDGDVPESHVRRLQLWWQIGQDGAAEVGGIVGV